MTIWIVVIVGLVLVLALLDREIYFYEGVHLGPRIQGWLYDKWANKYDSDKQASQAQDAQVLTQPLLEALAAVPEPFVLDLATGTGRLPFALCSEPRFTGHIIALDISQGMLARAAAKLAPYKDRVVLMRHTALPLPFPDNTFDVVCCLEALEVMPAVQAPLAELARVVRPGGLLMTSRGTEASGRVSKVCSVEKFTMLLLEAGFEQVEIRPWWKLFDRVRARKPGQLIPGGTRALTDIFRCPTCGMVKLKTVSPAALRCQQCGCEVTIDPAGIILS